MDDEYGGKPTKVPDKQQEYLQILQERNRLKKLASGKSKEALANEERERGFSTHFQGANRDKDKDQKPRQPAKAVVTINSSAKAHIAAANMERFIPSSAAPAPADRSESASRPRRGWSEPTKFILGRRLDVNPSDSNSPSTAGWGNKVAVDRVNLLGDFAPDSRPSESGVEREDDYADEDFDDANDEIENNDVPFIPDVSNNPTHGNAIQKLASESTSTPTISAPIGYTLSSRSSLSLEVEPSTRSESGKGIASLVDKAVKLRPFSPRAPTVLIVGKTSILSSDKVSQRESFSPTPGSKSAKLNVADSGLGHRGLNDEICNESNNIVDEPITYASSDPHSSGSNDLDHSLIQRIVGLPANQKSILKSLISKIDSSPSAAQDILKFIAKEDSAPSVQLNSAGSPARKSFAKPLSTNSDSAAAVSPQRNVPAIGTNTSTPILLPTKLITTKLLDSDATTSVSSIDGIMQQATSSISANFTLRLRVRLHSCWGKSKYVALQGIRLGLQAADGTSVTDVDVLNDFSVELSCGGNIIPKSSDYYRSLSQLFMSTRRTTSAGPTDAAWKMPMATNQVIEIAISGAFRPELVVGFSSVDDVLKYCTLRIWNTPSRSSGNIASVAGANDIDVYVGTKCIFTGSLPEPPPVSRAPGPPTLTLELGKSSNSKSTKEVSPADLEPKQVVAVENPSAEWLPRTSFSSPMRLVDPGQGVGSMEATAPSSEQRRFPMSSDNSASPDTNQSSTVPVWLLDAQRAKGENPSNGFLGNREIKETKILGAGVMPTNESSNRDTNNLGAVLAPSLVVKRASRRQASQVSASKSTPTSAHNDNIAPIRDSAVLLSKSREDLTSRPDTDSQASRFIQSRNIRQDDLSFRQSLEAMDASDRLNMGRLGARGGRRAVKQVLSTQSSLSAKENPGDTTISSDENIDCADDNLRIGTGGGSNSRRPQLVGAGVETVSIQGTDSVVVQPSGAVISKSTAATNSTTPLTSAPSTIALDRMRQRSHRIDQVQSHVRSALAGLAGMMQDIEAGPIVNANVADKLSAKDKKVGVEIEPPSRSRIGFSANDDEAYAKVRTRLSTPGARVNPLSRKFVDEDEDEEDDDNNSGDCGETMNSNGKDSSVEPSLSDYAGRNSNAAVEQRLAQAAFSVPTLPEGTILTVEVMSTWGDEFYVGLNGIEVFDGEGAMVWQNNAVESVDGNPRDINVLPEYRNDPRTVSNLVNGNNFTCDDLQVWLAPLGCFDANKEIQSRALISAYPERHPGTDCEVQASISVRFTRKITISMLRIFNYNKSRTHSARGVRLCRLLLDGLVLYFGEIHQAPGLLTSVDDASEIILFTDSEEILQKIARHQDSAGYYPDENSNYSSIAAHLRAANFACRPRSSDLATRVLDSPLYPTAPNGLRGSMLPGDQAWRPTTAAIVGADETQTKSDLSCVDVVSGLGDSNAIFDITTLKSLQSIPPQNMRSRPQLVTSKEIVEGRPDELENSLQLSASLNSMLNEFKASSIANNSSTGNNFHGSYGAGLTGQDSFFLANSDLVPCRKLRITIDSTYGDAFYVGLCGIQVLVGVNCSPIELTESMVNAEPKDMSAIGCFDDPRVLKNIINDWNDTTNDRLMWLIPFTIGANHYLDIDLKRTTNIAGFRIWNYNKGVHGSGAWEEDMLRGVKDITVAVDGNKLGSWIMRLAPGCDGVAFGQKVLLRNICRANGEFCPGISFSNGSRQSGLTRYITPVVKQDYETQLHPTGMLWRLVFHENWNDGYYIGLDAIKFFDVDGKLLDLDKAGATVSAVPHSLRDLSDTMAQDPRTPEVLFSASNVAGTSDQPTSAKLGENVGSPVSCWLSPLSRCMTEDERNRCAQRLNQATTKKLGAGKAGFSGDSESESFKFPLDNTIFIMFDYPVAISAIRIYNYSKTPARGVRDMSIYVDSNLIYMGSLVPSDRELLLENPSRRPGAEKIRAGQSILFTKDPNIIRAEKDRVPYCGATEQDVLCIDERQVIIRSRAMFNPPNAAAEGVTTNLQNRPTTSAGPLYQN